MCVRKVEVFANFLFSPQSDLYTLLSHNILRCIVENTVNMSDNEATIKAFLAKLGWDLETSGKRVEDVLKNKKLSNTLIYLSKEVRHELHLIRG